MKRFFATFSLAFSLLFFFATPVFAADDDNSIIGRINKQVPCMATGSCTSLDSILAVFAQVSQWLLGIAGSVMLLMFVWGGAEWVFSAGESGLIKSGKGKMTNAVIGIVLMFGALAIVRSIRVGLIGGEASGVATGGQCVINSDCGSGCCAGGYCSQASVCAAAKEGCPNGTDPECNPTGKTPWMACKKAATGGAATGNQCVIRCIGLSGICQLKTVACSIGYTAKGDAKDLCTDAAQQCCIKN